MGCRKHSPHPFKKDGRHIYDANKKSIGSAFVQSFGDKKGHEIAKSNASLWTEAPNLADIVEQYLDRMVSLGETETIPFLIAKEHYEKATETEYKF